MVLLLLLVLLTPIAPAAALDSWLLLLLTANAPAAASGSWLPLLLLLSVLLMLAGCDAPCCICSAACSTAARPPVTLRPVLLASHTAGV